MKFDVNWKWRGKGNPKKLPVRSIREFSVEIGVSAHVIIGMSHFKGATFPKPVFQTHTCQTDKNTNSKDSGGLFINYYYYHELKKWYKDYLTAKGAEDGRNEGKTEVQVSKDDGSLC